MQQVTHDTLATRTLGKTGIEVSVLGLDCGTIGFGNVLHEQGIAVVRHALDRGITYVDTAHHYESEHIVGDALFGADARAAAGKFRYGFYQPQHPLRAQSGAGRQWRFAREQGGRLGCLQRAG